MSAELALQIAIIDALKADQAVSALTGGRIYDGAPQGATLPCLALGETQTRNWDTASEPGTEHLLTLVVRSRAGGRREALEIAGAAIAVLDEAALALDGHRLVNLRVTASEASRAADHRSWRARIRLRAVTEPD